MVSRREVLMGAIAGVAALGRPPAAAPAHASQPSTPVKFDVPAGACDCHAHIFGAPQFPYVPERVYTPESTSVAEIRALHRALHTSRAVIIQPSVYGTNNACMLDAVGQLGASARGIAVIDERTPDSALDDMDRAGVRGIRINLETVGQTDPEVGRRRFQTAIERVKGRRWHIQIYTRLSVIEGIKDLVAASPVPIVVDHFGGAQASLGIGQPGFDALLNLMRTGKAYVKLSAVYRSSTQAPDYADLAPLAKALIAANPQRALWGTDWPHANSTPVPGRTATDVTPLLQIDDGRVLNQLATWAPDPGQRKIILVENPARLYGF
jgi:predicted TIM-barrel fold metal-dependent hydrolase